MEGVQAISMLRDNGHYDDMCDLEVGAGWLNTCSFQFWSPAPEVQFQAQDPNLELFTLTVPISRRNAGRYPAIN